jgi:hypothetical protein
MRNILLIGVFAVAIPFFAYAQTEPSSTKQNVAPAQGSDPVEQALMRLDRELMDAAMRNDKATMERIELATAIFINPGGGIEERGQPGTAGPKIESIETQDVRVRVHGDTAILTGRANVKGRFANGADITGSYRYMRVFVKTKGEWRVAATQVTRIAPPPKPSPTP